MPRDLVDVGFGHQILLVSKRRVKGNYFFFDFDVLPAELLKGQVRTEVLIFLHPDQLLCEPKLLFVELVFFMNQHELPFESTQSNWEKSEVLFELFGTLFFFKCRVNLSLEKVVDAISFLLGFLNWGYFRFFCEAGTEQLRVGGLLVYFSAFERDLGLKEGVARLFDAALLGGIFRFDL